MNLRRKMLTLDRGLLLNQGSKKDLMLVIIIKSYVFLILGLMFCKNIKMFTYEVNGFIKPGADVCFVAVLHWDTLVLVVSLKVIRAVGRHVDQGGNAKGVQHIFSGCMICTSQVEKRQNFHWSSL